MLAIYIWTGVIGLVLVLYSVIMGAQHGGDAGSVDHGGIGHGDMGHGDAGHGASGGQEGDSDAGTSDPAWTLFLSMRFWTFFAMFFGILGVIMTVGTSWHEPMVGSVAGIGGLIAGLTIALTMRLVQRNEIDSNVSTKDLVGVEGTLLVSAREGQLGRVRIETKGDIVDLLAISDDAKALPAGTPVVIVGVDDDRVRVVERSDVFG
ncbi:MAG: NfeD family protein [Fimbriimonadaceae bacterium]|nr:NfeD family protein [Fimbriimonadaceae bacterium]